MGTTIEHEREAPWWVRALDRVRRLCRYHLRTGPQVYRWVTPHLKRPILTEIVPGVRMWVDLRQSAEVHAWWAGRRYELPTIDVLLEWCETADHFFDIGANFGFVSYLVHQATAAEVYAFEPNTALVARIERAKADNGLERLHPQPLGLADANGELEFRLVGDDESHATFAPHPQAHDEAAVVPVYRFDDWRTRAGLDLPAQPTWVAKLDVEGYELRVLHGMEEALRKQAFRGLVVELNDFTLELAGTNGEEVRAYLADVGYRPLDLPPSHRHMNGFFVPA